MSKFYFECNSCGHKTLSFKDWFDAGQKCACCGDIYSKTRYARDVDYKALLSKKVIPNLWHYKELLPLNGEQYTSFGEGVLPIDHWKNIEAIARDYFNVDCSLRVLRNDNNPGTGTFKDLAGTVVASVLAENGIKDYVVASTGNIGAALSRYLAVNNITLHAFIPENSPDLQQAEIASNGGNVFRVKGDYHVAKCLAKAFAKKHNFLLAATGIDPTRIEAKKTMAYEIVRQLGRQADVFVQALSGGTGPLGLFKGNEELIARGIISKQTRLILSQSYCCSPMADAYQKAKAEHFTGDWKTQYPVYENPETDITTIATGNPTLYPYVSDVVHKSGGDIVAVNEKIAKDTYKLVALLEGVKIGPAATIGVLGFFHAAKHGLIKNGDLVVLNSGEGAKRTPAYLSQFISDQYVSSVDDCAIQSIQQSREQAVLDYIDLIR